MGGDDAPARVVEGVLLAVRELGLALELVGPIADLEPRLAREPDRARLSLTLVDAPEHVGMADRPRDALRKRATSIRVAVERVRTGEVSGLFSAGHTGATVVAAVAGLGLLPGVERPALAVTIPTARGQAVLLDVGATVDCQPAHLRQFAAMGCAYAQVALGRTATHTGAGPGLAVRTHTSGLIERIPLALTVGRDLGKGQFAQRLPAFSWVENPR